MSRKRVATSRNGRHTSSVNDGLDMRSRYEQALAEVEEMKQALREHAQHVAAREKELEELRLEVAGRQGRRRAPARDNTARTAELDRAVAEAEKREQEALQELALAKAERERLDEREQAIRQVERELAGLRVQLAEERARLAGTAAPTEPEPVREPEPESEPPPPTPLPQPPAEPDLEPAAGAELRRSRRS
jgi:septal ring factor EnvC (AmiA/AmiB activator)